MAMIERGHEVLASIARIPKVFIAQIEGHALGGGLEITLACDLRFGARGTLQARRAGGDARAAAGQRRHAAAAADHRRAQGAGPDGHRAARSRPGEAHGARHPQPPVRGGGDRGEDARVRGAAGRRRHRGDRRDQAHHLRGHRDADRRRARARARRASRGCSTPRTRPRASASFAEKRKPEFKGA